MSNSQVLRYRTLRALGFSLVINLGFPAVHLGWGARLYACTRYAGLEIHAEVAAAVARL